MTLNCQMYLKKLLKISYLASIAVNGLNPSKSLRDGAKLLALPLRNMIKLSIKLSTFPEECKIAKLKPIFKRGARTDPEN